ncbi:MAG: rod shape-determining protein RodA [Clostridia bacterium]|nr:rod shape-determining protein RodA [Clostridia bacterium]
MNRKILKNIEWSIIVCVVILIAIGCVALYSATQSTEHDELIKQLIWLGISIPIVVAIIATDYEIIIKAAPVGYGVMLLLLVAVLFTQPINGATSWFTLGSFSLQPAEFTKIFVILLLALVISKVQKEGKNEISKPLKLGLCLLVVVVPVLLIIKQPDYGTAIAFVIATIFMLYAAGINKKYILGSVLLTIVVLPVMYLYILPDHAKTRIDVFLNPDLDPRGSGYNIIQSKLAIGSGQLLGMGVKQGNQTQLGYLYPKTTDFIFSVIGEEMGFVIAGLIIVLYVVLITKIIYIAKTAKDDKGSYVAIGIAGIFAFHMVENIGMAMGLLPITGVPLPFVSYGGSSLLTNLVLIGLVLNISGRRKKSLFIE